MANIIKVKVAKVSAQPTTNGNYIHTVKTEGKKEVVFGVEKPASQLTYFIALPSAVPVGTEDNLDLDKFRVEERPYEVADQDTGEMKTLMLKWLHIK